MSSEARRRAERCFALARSTTFGPERETAIARGTAIAEAAGLSLDEFDVPGRAPRKATGEPLFGGHGIFGDNFRYATVDVRAFEEIVRQANEKARRMNEVAEEAQKRAAYAHNAGVSAAVEFLAAKGFNVCQSVGRFLFVNEEGRTVLLTAHDVISMARRAGWPR